MKQTRTIFVRALLPLMTLLGSASCQDVWIDDVRPPAREVGFYAGGVSTKTEMLADGLGAVWCAGDKLALWARNSSGTFTLSDQIFTTHGIDGRRGFFTSTLASAMPAGTYTYYCCYPVPASVSGTLATFSLPGKQDGKASGGVDIMVAEPLNHSALTSIPDPEDHSGMSMSMNRMMHQFRFWLPQEYDTIGEDILEITMTMPQDIAGNMTLDVSDPDSAPSLSDGTNTLLLDLAEPISGSSSLENAEFACAAVFPYTGTYTDSDYMNLQIYSQKYKVNVDPISLSGRTFLAGHSTPVCVLPVSVEEYYRLTMLIGDNHIGEALTNVAIKFDGSTWYSFANDGTYSNFTHKVEAYGDDGKAAYDLIISSIEAGTATYVYETEHALVERPLTSSMMTSDGNRIVLDLGDVPYLLYEDFSTSEAVAHDDDYAPGYNSDTNLGGYLLNGFMPLDGWNASRFSIIKGDLIRINCRYQSGAWVVGRYCGRLDTPALKYLKEGASVNVMFEFDKAFSIPAGQGVDDSAYISARFKVGTHTKSDTDALNGVNSNSVNSNSTIIYTSGLTGSESIVNMTTMQIPVSSATSATRMVIYPDTDYSASKIAANLVYYLYIDNIKVYIQN